MKIDMQRMSFNNLFEAQAFKEGQARTFGAKILVPKGSDTDKAIWAEIKRVAAEKFGKKADAIIEKHKGNNMKFCYCDGDVSGRDEEEGMMVLNCKRREGDGRPTVLDKDKSPLQPADGKPYSGCYVNVVFDIYAQTGDYEGVRCGLKGIQFAKDGDAFSGASKASEDDFDSVEDSDDLS